VGKVRKIVTTVLIAGALLPALSPGESFGGQSQSRVAALDAFHSMPEVNADQAKLVTLEVAWASMRPYSPNTNHPSAEERARLKTSQAAMMAEPSVKAAFDEWRRVGEIQSQRDTIARGRMRLLSSALLVVAALVIVAGASRLRRKHIRSGALLLAAGFASLPMFTPNARYGSFDLPVVSLFSQQQDYASRPYIPQLARTAAPAGDTWTTAALDATRASVPANYAPSFGSFGADPDVPGARGRLVWAGIVGCLAALGALLLPRLGRLRTWSPSFRRHFPTLWPARTPLA
jgi:hypothetical protein